MVATLLIGVSLSKSKYGRRYGLGVRDRFVELVCSGVSVVEAAAEVGASPRAGRYWWVESGGMPLRMGRLGGVGPQPAAGSRGRALTRDERVVIQVGLRAGWSYARIGREIGRDRSVVWREARRHAAPDGGYRASRAELLAARDRRRPKRSKLAGNPTLCRRIEEWMDQGWSPRLIAHALAVEAGADDTGRVSHETIYRALYVQTRGTLRADLARKLSLKRRVRASRGTPRRSSSPFKEAFTISQRPAEVADRAVPGHWEGDLILGVGGKSAVGTLVERTTRFVILLHLPGTHTADEVATAMIREMTKLPEHLRRSITWDRGTELADYRRIQVALDTKLFFCDPHSPWQRGSNENTNRLLRFWLEKGTDLRTHTPADLRRIAATLNARPRPTLDYQTPAERLTQLLTEAA